jgi:hypothetical protein
LGRRVSELDHDQGSVASRAKTQPLKGCADMAVHGRRAQAQEQTYLFAAEMLCDVAKDLALSRA